MHFSIFIFSSIFASLFYLFDLSSLLVFILFFLFNLFIYLLDFFVFSFFCLFYFCRSYGRMSRMWETVSKRRIRFDTTFSGNNFATQNFESEKCGKELYHSIFKIYTYLLLAQWLTIEWQNVNCDEFEDRDL